VRHHREKIKALKVAYITEELNMNTKMAQKFWPIYNRYEEQKRELHRREHIDLEEAEKFSEAQAQEMLKEYIAVEREEYVIKNNYLQILAKFLLQERSLSFINWKPISIKSYLKNTAQERKRKK
jgi:hypothetical protein